MAVGPRVFAQLTRGIPDTLEMLDLGGDQRWVRRELLKGALGDPVPQLGQRESDSQAVTTPTVRGNNGISGYARRSAPELGKMAFDMKVEYAVAQIQNSLAKQKTPKQESIDPERSPTLNKRPYRRGSY